jgi:hypothetical protein
MTTQEISLNKNHPQVDITASEGAFNLAASLREIEEAGYGDRLIRVTVNTTIEILPPKQI